MVTTFSGASVAQWTAPRRLNRQRFDGGAGDDDLSCRFSCKEDGRLPTVPVAIDCFTGWLARLDNEDRPQSPAALPRCRGGAQFPRCR
ncbi:hypothetical protein AGR5A_Cc90061 [Agrobacterium genomosp. 5 str. CFBP 6626]|nr:hypothetical protein AGR5A_Cc90061 [Agrobacterium genomosp. 5 str. CFBP 6626]